MHRRQEHRAGPKAPGRHHQEALRGQVQAAQVPEAGQEDQAGQNHQPPLKQFVVGEGRRRKGQLQELGEVGDV